MRNYSIRGLLNIPGYKIDQVLKKTERELHIRVVPYKKNQGQCSGCGGRHHSIHSVKEIRAEDLGIGTRRLFLYIQKRRYYCPVDKRIHTEALPWIRMGRRVTNGFAASLNRLTAITTNQEAGWYLGLDDEQVYRIDRATLERLAKKRLEPTQASLNISVDEVAWKKHHRYLTNVIDVDQRLVVWNEKGRKAAVLDQYYKCLGDQACKGIESVALDGARTYISSTSRYATNALIVLDRFHAAQKATKALDRVRRDELRKARSEKHDELIALSGCKQRFILLKSRSKLSHKQSATLQRLCEINQPIYKALLLKESFLQVYQLQDEEQARQHLQQWIVEALNSGLKPFEEMASSVRDKAQLILNWFKKRISSSISEGFNNKIKRLKRMAYGYKDIDYFRLKIHQHCGLLNPRRFPT
jgi:transposase